MKNRRIIKIFGIMFILAMLLAAIPVLPVFATTTYGVSLTPTQGEIGNTITVHGTRVPAASEPLVANIYISPNNVAIGANISTVALSYTRLRYGVYIYTTLDGPTAGNFSTTFVVPATIPASTDPLAGGANAHTVVSGTYYVYVTIGSTTSSTPWYIVAKATFTVTTPTLDPLSPASGPPGTQVTLTGSNLPPSVALVFKFDTTTLTPTGDTTTRTNGLFLSSITIPAGVSAGAHTIYVTAGTGITAVTLSATFTVSATATATIESVTPSSGAPGTVVTLTGSNFPVSTTLSFSFDTTAVAVTSGDTATRTSGIFITAITIPLTATAGAHSITAIAGAGTATGTFTVTGGATATIALSPVTGAAGTSVTISGTNFAASTALVFTFDTTPLTPTSGSTQTGTTGIFASIITIPSTATAGAHTITATAGTSADSDTFTVTGTSTTPLTLDHTSGAIGTTITIAGSGFTASHAFTVSYNNNDGTSSNTTGTTQSNGFFFASFQVPSSAHGVHTITATDGTHIAAADFTVEATAPAVPQPNRPYMNEAVAPPATFDWADVTDDSAPVTYNLQIALDATFTTDNILINKTGITQSGYTLTESDQAKLTVGVTYYWREKAVDAALNESAWTGANSFSLSQPFSFTGWPLYTTLGIAAFLLFLIGIWLGRRTAYNY
ncbi:MAG: autotransporter outer membrane beta-barrel domain-containing protein [Dehalococcoidales bacterium]